MVKNPPANAGDIREVDLIPGSGRSPAERNGNPLQYSWLENPMDTGAWQAVVHRLQRVRHDRSDLAHVRCFLFVNILNNPFYSFHLLLFSFRAWSVSPPLLHKLLIIHRLAAILASFANAPWKCLSLKISPFSAKTFSLPMPLRYLCYLYCFINVWFSLQIINCMMTVTKFQNYSFHTNDLMMSWWCSANTWSSHHS